MSFLVSPGVQVNELDLTNVVPAVSASIGGFAGAFNWGPVEEIRTVTSEKELAVTFGTPTSGTARSFLTAASYLTYSNNLKVVRAVKSTALNATSGFDGNQGYLIKNLDAYEAAGLSGGTATVGAWAARCPGALGNSLSVSVCPASSVAFSAWTYKGLFTAAPGTSESATKGGSSSDELHIVVIDNLGKFTGTAGTVLETFAFVSQASDALNVDGTSNYYQTVVNSKSKYLFWLDHDETLTDAGKSIYSETTFTTGTAALEYTLTGGTEDVDTLPTTGDVEAALDLLADAETVDVNLLFTAGDAAASSGVTDTELANYIIAIANNRKDCLAVVSPPIEYSTSATPSTDVLAWAATVSRSSYGVIDSSAVKVYDKYNDVYRWITAAGHIAGLCAYTDQVADAWYSPAGFTRGQLRNVAKLAWNPKQADRDALYNLGVNPLVSFPGQGTVLYGDKTALAKPSAFDHINVRRLFIVLEKAIATAAKGQLFEFNDEFTRAMFRNMVEPFLRDVKGRRGVTDFLVVCDSTNNTGEVIDRNEFRADIYVKPTRSINFIKLNFIATRTGVSFSEIVGTNSSATPNL